MRAGHGKWPGAGGYGKGEFADNSTSVIGNLRRQTGLVGFDLPTEAVWEYACRAGTASDCNSGLNFDGEGYSHLARFSANSACGATGDYAYNSANVYAYTSAQGGSAIVGSYRPNAWGLYDMHGNLAEICLDYYQADVSDQTGADPWGPELPQGTTSSNDRVGKGGCYYLDYRYLAPSQRMKVAPNSATPHIGARICLTVF